MVLFSNGYLRDTLSRCRQQALNLVESTTAEQLSGDLSPVGERLFEAFALRQVDLGQQPFLLDEPKPTAPRGGVERLLWEFRIPFDGSASILLEQANTFSSAPPQYATVYGEQVAIDLSLPVTLSSDDVRVVLDRELAEVRRQLDFGNQQVASENQALRAEIERALARRAASFAAGRQASADLGFPLLTRPTAPAPLPLERIPLDLPPAEPETPGPQRRALADEAYRGILATIESFGRALERIPETFAGLGEVELRDFLLVILNATYRGEAAGEVFNNHGKTDILIRHGDENLFIGECKIWNGLAAADQALTGQLFNYVTWRDTAAALIVFVRGASEPTLLIRKAYDLLAEHPTRAEPPPPFHAGARHDFVMRHPDDAQRLLRISLLTFVVAAGS